MWNQRHRPPGSNFSGGQRRGEVGSTTVFRQSSRTLVYLANRPQMLGWLSIRCHLINFRDDSAACCRCPFSQLPDGPNTYIRCGAMASLSGSQIVEPCAWADGKGSSVIAAATASGRQPHCMFGINADAPKGTGPDRLPSFAIRPLRQLIGMDSALTATVLPTPGRSGVPCPSATPNRDNS